MKELVFEVLNGVTKQLIRIISIPVTTPVEEIIASIWNMGALVEINLKEIK